MENSNLVSISADLAYDDSGNQCVLVKIQTDGYELNVWIPISDIPKLRNLPKWESGSKRIGSSAGAGSFWSLDDDTLSILIGQDNQVWDFGVSLNATSLRQIIEEAERASQSAA